MGKSGESGKKLEKVVESEEKWWKLVNSGEKWWKVAKSGEKWRKSGNKRPPGLIAPLLKFCNLLGNPPINTTKGRDLIFNEGIRLLNMADNIFSFIYLYLPTFTPYLPLFGYIYP